MIRRCCLAVALVALVTASHAEDNKGETIELFNGKNFDNWKFFLDPKAKDVKPEDVWSVDKGVIICKGKPNGYMITEKEYENYILELEWRWGGKKGNSGVFVHVSGKDQIWPKGVEAQLLADNAGDFWLVGGFKLSVDEARKKGGRVVRMKTEKPVENEVGEWNKYRITCKADTIKLEINGQTVNEGTGAETSKGKILLQSEGAEIYFRNIELKHLR